MQCIFVKVKCKHAMVFDHLFNLFRIVSDIIETKINVYNTVCTDHLKQLDVSCVQSSEKALKLAMIQHPILIESQLLEIDRVSEILIISGDDEQVGY